MRWRDYRTRSGGRPVKAFIDSLPDDEAAAIVGAMREIQDHGLSWARHLRGDVYEVRAFGRRGYRILFAQETKFVLLSLSGFVKHSAKTPRAQLELAEKRLTDWRLRGRRLS